MTDTPPAFGSPEYTAVINETYNHELLTCMDLIGRDDFYGVVAWEGLRFFGEKLGLTADSHLLDIGSGIGGPARHLARTYGCRVTGIDMSEFNHRTAVERTRAAGLDHLVGFRHGGALELPIPDAAFTHVFGSETWCYFPDKVALYRLAYRALRPGGVIAFLEAACDAPVRLRTEDHLATVRYESVPRYAEMLHAAGFEGVCHFDTTALAARDVARSLFRLITGRERVIAAVGAEVYFGILEVWAEFTAYFAEGRLTHCGFLAQKS